MNKPKDKQTKTQIIAREGIKPVCVCFGLMLLFIFLNLEFLALIALICVILAAFIFRNTERIAQNRADNAIIAPCDGLIKDIFTRDSSTIVAIKINIFDCGIFRVPAYIERIKSKFRFGLFLRGDKNLQAILNTRHQVSGFRGSEKIFSITLLPEMWNKANIYALDSSESSYCRESSGESSRDSSGKTFERENPDSAHETHDSSVFLGDRLGFMKYGYLLLEIHKPCKLKADKGQNLFAGVSLLGVFSESSGDSARDSSDSTRDSKESDSKESADSTNRDSKESTLDSDSTSTKTAQSSATSAFGGIL